MVEDAATTEATSHGATIRATRSRAEPRKGALRRVLAPAALGIGSAIGLLFLANPISSLRPDQVWQKDLLQEFILARSLLDGSNPYSAPMRSPVAVYPYPVAHPPVSGAFFLPFAAFDFPTAAVGWFVFEIVCLAVSVYMFGRALGFRPPPLFVLTVTACAFAWYPVGSDLYWGQMALVQLPFLTAAWWALRQERHGLAGLFAGICILVKPFLWPLALFFLVRRNWRAFLASGSTVAAGYVLTVLRLGLDAHLTYLTKVMPAIDDAFKAYPENISLWSLGWRLFDGTGSSVVTTASAPPIVKDVAAAAVVSAAVPVVAFVLGVAVLARMRNAPLGLGLVVCISIMVSPISWGHYLVLALVPVVEVGSRLDRLHFPRRETGAALVVAATLLLSNQMWKALAMLVFGEPAMGARELPFAVALAAGGPAVGAVGLAVLVAALGLGKTGSTLQPASNDVR